MSNCRIHACNSRNEQLPNPAIFELTNPQSYCGEDRGVNPNRTTTTNSIFTPLHYAARNCHFEIIELLVQNGADCSTSTPEWDGARSAIHLVLLEPGLPRYRADCLRLLLRYGAKIDQPDGAGRTPLHWAAQHGELGKVKWLISNRANLEAITKDDLTPLHLAVEARGPEISRLLLDAGSNKDAGMKYCGKTALHIVSRGNSIDLVKELLARKAFVEPLCTNILDYKLNPGIYMSTTPLSMAVHNDNLEIIELLVKAGANLDYNIDVEENNAEAIRILLGYTPPATTQLKRAAEAGNTSVIKELLAEGVEADVECTDNNQYPSLFIAAYSGHVDAVKLLLDHGADPERKVEVQDASSGKKEECRAGEYFKPDVSEQNRSRIRAMLPHFPRGDNSRDSSA